MGHSLLNGWINKEMIDTWAEEELNEKQRILQRITRTCRSWTNVVPSSDLVKDLNLLVWNFLPLFFVMAVCLESIIKL